MSCKMDGRLVVCKLEMIRSACVGACASGWTGTLAVSIPRRKGVELVEKLEVQWLACSETLHMCCSRCLPRSVDNDGA
jgi:hypothetical protein